MSLKSEKIRVGIIRCDLHAIYYANLIQPHDPYLLRKPELGKGGYFYFYTHYTKQKELAFPTVSGFEITKLWDIDRLLAENMSKIYYNKPQVCGTFEEVSDDVDLVLVADCNGDGSDHLKLASPGIKKGVPTFIDKPFAYEYKDARTMVDLANQHKTPIMSLSLLRELPHVSKFRSRFAEIAPIGLGVIRGHGGDLAGHIHGIALAQHLFGKGVEWVEVMGDMQLEYLHMHYPGRDKGVEVVIINTHVGGPHCAMYASVYSQKGAIHSPDFGDWTFPEGVGKILRMIRKMVTTNEPQAPYAEMLECIAVAAAARLSQKAGKKIYIKDVV